MKMTPVNVTTCDSVHGREGCPPGCVRRGALCWGVCVALVRPGPKVGDWVLHPELCVGGCVSTRVRVVRPVCAQWAVGG